MESLNLINHMTGKVDTCSMRIKCEVYHQQENEGVKVVRFVHTILKNSELKFDVTQLDWLNILWAVVL